MSLTSQLITETFPDLDKVERLNIEAFPEEERVPLSEFLRYTDNDDANFFAFYNEEEFVGFAFSIYNQKAFYVSFFAIMPHLRSHGYGQEIIEKLVERMDMNHIVAQMRELEHYNSEVAKKCPWVPSNTKTER